MPGFEAVSWHVLLAPAATPKPIVDRLHAEMKRITGNAEFQKKVTTIGLLPINTGVGRRHEGLHEGRAGPLGRAGQEARPGRLAVTVARDQVRLNTRTGRNSPCSSTPIAIGWPRRQRIGVAAHDRRIAAADQHATGRARCGRVLLADVELGEPCERGLDAEQRAGERCTAVVERGRPRRAPRA